MTRRKTEPNPRTALLAEFAAQIGGWNAGPPGSIGRLGTSCNIDNDRAVVSYMLESYKRSQTYDLKQELIRLKARLFDLQERGK